MSLRGAIHSLQTGTYTVTRRAASTYLVGRAVAGATTTFTTVASVQPLTGRRLIPAPEGFRGEEQKEMFATTELRGYSDAPAAPPADVVTLTTPSGVDEPWTVITCSRWEGLSGSPHWRAVLARSVAS